MALILKNNSSDTFSYLAGQVVVPSESTLNVDSIYWFGLLTDVDFIASMRLNNVILSDGSKDYSYPESEDFLRTLVREQNTAIRDIDGASIVRNKAAKKGWTFCSLPFEFQTSRLSNTLYSQNVDGSTRPFITMRAYDADNNEVTTPGLLDVNYASIVKTEVDFEPPYDYEIIGGDLRTLTTISVDIRLWIIAAPDIPAIYGGSKEMGGGINLRYLSPGNVWSVDGRVTKYATYSAITHSNKIRLVFKYPAGYREDLHAVIQLYRQ